MSVEEGFAELHKRIDELLATIEEKQKLIDMQAETLRKVNNTLAETMDLLELFTSGN